MPEAKKSPVSIAEYLQAIYDNVPLVYAAGGAAWKRSFWDNYQSKGLRADYAEAFSGKGWTVDYFTPTYSIHPTESAQNMFARSALAIDLSDKLSTLSVSVTLDDATDISGIYYDTDFTRVPKITLGGMLTSSIWRLFTDSDSLVTIDEIEITQDFMDSNTSALWYQCFERCYALKNLTFSGSGFINQSIDLQWSTLLTKPSIVNVMSYLSLTASDLICRLSLEAVNRDFESSDGSNDGASSDEWNALVGAVPNWSIALV